MVLAVSELADTAPKSLQVLKNVLADLVTRGGRVVLFHQSLAPKLAVLNELGGVHLGSHDQKSSKLSLWGSGEPLVIVQLPVSDTVTFLQQVGKMSARVGAARVVLGWRDGGIKSKRGKRMSVIDSSRLSRLSRRGDPLPGLIKKMLQAGVGTVSVCRLDQLDVELFTYEGSGSYCACRHYCRVRRLRLDDFVTVLAIINRGEKEGFLLSRSRSELMDILLNGYGAFINDQLVGVAGVLTAPYKAELSGEIVALYTMSRFAGEGVGSHLLKQIKQDAKKIGLASLFACTCSSRVVEFFKMQGFAPVTNKKIPAAKWASYDGGRQQRVTSMQVLFKTGSNKKGKKSG